MRVTKGVPLIAAVYLCAILAFGTDEPVGPTRRITAPIDETHLVRLGGRVHPLARPEFDRGPVPADLPMARMILLLNSTPEQQAALEQLLTDLQDRSSPLYHRWLTSQEFGERFGASQPDIDTITAWLTTHGFQVNNVAQNRRMIEFSGTAAQVSTAFHIAIHRFQIKGEFRYANVIVPSIPAALAPVVAGFVSLHNFPRRPMHHVERLAGESEFIAPELTSSTTGNHYLTPYDLATIYNIAPLWNQGIDGTGQKIAIVGRTQFSSYDVTSFRSRFGLPYKYPNVVLNGDDPGYLSQGEQIEALLDVEWSGAVAKGADIYFVLSKSTNTADGVDLSSLYAVERNVAPVISVSFGFCESEDPNGFYGVVWQQAAAQGISVVVASGDSGSAGCDWSGPATHGLAVSGLAATPHNAAVGGTALNENGDNATYWNSTNDSHYASAKTYIPETTWNESSGTSLIAGGGGVSALYPAPIWQTGTGVPTQDPGTTGQHHRYLPDISFSSALHDAYVVCMAGSCGSGSFYAVAGTSAAAPVFAGLMALVNHQTGSIQGNPNFYLYPLSKVPGVFHDVTTGNNAVPCSSGTGCLDGTMSGYSAAPGFDLATGWGSVDASALVTNWSSVSFQPTTTTGSVTPPTVQHGSPITLSATVSASSGTPTGAVAAYVIGNGGVTTELGAATLSDGTVSGDTNLAPGGSGTLYFRYGGDGVYGSSKSAGIPITVTPEPTTVSVTAPATLSGGDPIAITGVVAGQSSVGAPSGGVAVVQGTTQVGWLGLDKTGSFSGTLYYYPSAVGPVTFTVKYSGDTSFSSGSSSITVTYNKYTPNPRMYCSNSSKDVLQGTGIQCSVNISNPGPVPTGTIQFFDSGTAIGNPVQVTSWTGTITLMLGAGTHQISAQYSGDSNYNPASSGPATVNVVETGTINISIGGQLSTASAPGQTVWAYVSVFPLQFGPGLTGVVTLYDGSTALDTYTAQGTYSISASFALNTATNPMALGTHSLIATYTSDPTWPNTTSAAANLLISNPDFTITGLNPVTLTRGSMTTLVPWINPIAGLSGNMSLSCTGAPAESTCTVDPTVYVWGYSSTGFNVTINTTAPHSAATQSDITISHGSGDRWKYGAGRFAFALLLLGLPSVRRQSKSFLLLLTLALLLPLVSCGGGGGGGASTTSVALGGTGGATPTITDPGTPTGTYTLTITGTYGSGASAIAHSYPFQLTIQ